jgi:hypothetical protein
MGTRMNFYHYLLETLLICIHEKKLDISLDTAQHTVTI